MDNDWCAMAAPGLYYTLREFQESDKEESVQLYDFLPSRDEAFKEILARLKNCLLAESS